MFKGQHFCHSFSPCFALTNYKIIYKNKQIMLSVVSLADYKNEKNWSNQKHKEKE